MVSLACEDPARISVYPPSTANAARSANPHLLVPALHKKSWAVIDRPYSLGCATVGALYERPRCIFCAKPLVPRADQLDFLAGFSFEGKDR